jgi:hypothetical protein
MQPLLRNQGGAVVRIKHRRATETRARRPAKSTGRTPRRGPGTGKSITSTKGRKKVSAKGAKIPKAPPTVVRIRELDPREKCGPNTSVQRLFRVDARDDGLLNVHLVFLDRHGLYCEHGPACFVVNEVKRQSLVRTI